MHISRHFQPHSLFYAITLLAHVSLTFTESLSAPKQVNPGAANQGRSNIVHLSSVNHSAAGNDCSSPHTPRQFVTDSWCIYKKICHVCLSVSFYIYINNMPHYIVILHALHNLSFSFTITFTFNNHKTIVEIHYSFNNNIFDV